MPPPRHRHLYTAVSLLLFLSTISPTTSTPPPLTLTLVNNCPFTLHPAIQPSAGFPVLQNGGFPLPPLSHLSFPGPTSLWSGRIWARTGCTQSGPSFCCATGDCSNRLQCNGLGGSTPATLVQLTLHHGNSDLSSYGVSLVDGFNVPLTVTPHEGRGTCPVVGCRANLLESCPDPLKVWSGGSGGSGGSVVGCKSGCEAFGTDELCCRNGFNSPVTCKGSSFSEFFKQACPATFTYAHDTPSLMHQCSSPRELKVIFCQ